MVKLCVLQTVICLIFFAVHNTQSDFQRSPTSRTGFTELGRFDDCGVDAVPVDTFDASTRIQCGLRCLRDSQCLSYEFNEVNQTCNLHSIGALLNLVPKFGFIYADGDQPNVGIQRPCDQSPCNPGQICTEECAPNGFTCTCPEGLEGDNCDGLIPIHGGFSDWGNWTQCSDSCIITSYRNCTNPEPVGSGNPCYGANTRQQACQQCNVRPYIGCLATADVDNLNPVEIYSGGANSVSYCMELCAAESYRYIAVAKLHCQCIRDMDSPSPSLLQESYCRKTCPGDDSQMCGHKYNRYWSIHEITQPGTTYKGCFSGSITDGFVAIDNAFSAKVESATWDPYYFADFTTDDPATVTEDLKDDATNCPNVTVCSNETVCSNATSCVNETVCRNETRCPDPYCSVLVNVTVLVSGNGTVDGTVFGNGTLDNDTVSGNGTVGNETLSGNGTASDNGTVSDYDAMFDNETLSGNETDDQYKVVETLAYGMLINGTCVIDADGTPCSVSLNGTLQYGTMKNGSCLLDGAPCVVDTGLDVRSGGIIGGDCVIDGSPCETEDGLEGKMVTGYCQELPETTTPEVGTTDSPSTSDPYLGLDVQQCVDNCIAMDFQFVGLWNGTSCTCFNSLAGLAINNGGSCDVSCPGGDVDGPLCGGDDATTVYELDILGMTHWTPNYNTDDPSVDGDDIEQAADIPWVCKEPQDITCTVAGTGADFSSTGDNLNSACTITDGINCTAAAQTNWVNITYTFNDHRIVQQTSLVNVTNLVCADYANATDLSGCGGGSGGCGLNQTEVCVNGSAMCVDTADVSDGDVVKICNNVTVETTITNNVNESFVNTGWHMNATSTASCHDYQVSFKCSREHGKLLGCHTRGDINNIVTSMSLSDLTIQNCGDYCANLGYRLFAMRKDSRECACDNTVGTDSKELSYCFMTCGADNEPCGGPGLESVYTADCNLPFNVTHDQMQGDLYHYNEAKDDSKFWFAPLADNTDRRLDNFTNFGLTWEVSIDLGQVQPLSKIVTKGMYIKKMNQMTGATEFRLGTKRDDSSPLELYGDKTTGEVMTFTVRDVSIETTHILDRLVPARYVYILVDDYLYFPGLKFELYGCNI